jgi:hypothetical protein
VSNKLPISMLREQTSQAFFMELIEQLHCKDSGQIVALAEG